MALRFYRLPDDRLMQNNPSLIRNNPPLSRNNAGLPKVIGQVRCEVFPRFLGGMKYSLYFCNTMTKIRNIAFDLGGVVLALSYEQAVRRFEEIGLHDARQQLDAFEQRGIFGDLEAGRITTGDFRRELSKMVGRQLSRASRLRWGTWST